MEKNERIETQVKWLGEKAQVLITVWVEWAKMQPEPEGSTENNKYVLKKLAAIAHSETMQESIKLKQEYTKSLRTQQEIENSVPYVLHNCVKYSLYYISLQKLFHTP